MTPGEKVTVVIEPGSSTLQIAKILAKNRLITHPYFFWLTVKLKQVDKKLMAGEYDFRGGVSSTQIIETLKKGPELKFFKVTIPEGLTIDQTAELVAKKTRIDEQQFKQLAKTGASEFKEYGFLADNPSSNLEGYLFPKTYEVSLKASADDFIQVMLKQFGKETAPLDWSFAKTHNLTKHQIITIASLIEREAKLDEERPLISAVIYNRLQKNMLLQFCATVQYALPAWKEKLTDEDLQTESPYNTYLHPGLPPGPIANPGLASIKAALNPAKVDYLYFVVSGTEGQHTFTNSYEEFLKAKAKITK